MTKTVLVTGAAGFVARQVLRALDSQDVALRLVVREGGRPAPASHRVERVIASPDLFAESQAWWRDVCAGVDTVVHLAWYAEPGQYLDSTRNIDCLAGTLALAKGAAAAGVRRVAGVGTCFEYDVSGGAVSVETPLRPSTAYAAAKAATFLMLSQWLPAHQVEFVWCRLFYLYGDGEDARRLVPYVRARLAAGEPVDLTDGTQVRDYLDVADAGRMIADAALGHDQGPVNICSGVPVSVRALAERIADEYGRRDLLRFGTRPLNPFDPPAVVGLRNGARA